MTDMQSSYPYSPSSGKNAPENPIYQLIQEGNHAYKQNNFELAESCFQKALAIHSDQPGVLYNLGLAYTQTGKTENAKNCLEKAISLKPDYAEAINSLGNLFLDKGNKEAAKEKYKKAVSARHDFYPAYTNLGFVHLGKGEITEAIHCFSRVIQIQPELMDARIHLGDALKYSGRLQEAEETYKEVISRANSDQSVTLARAKTHLGLLKLLQKKPEKGFSLYENRYALPEFREIAGLTPRWDGKPVKTLFVLPEQGYGDTIQFARYLPLALQRAEKVIFRTRKALTPLLEKMHPDIVIAGKEEPVKYDAGCGLMSLPYFFFSNLKSLPGQTPYLRADLETIRYFRKTFSPGNIHVGLAWSGNPKNRIDEMRSLHLEALAPLAKIPGVIFHSLQKGERAKEVRNPPKGMKIIDWSDTLADFSVTAGLIQALDLVVSTCTSIPHLAGAAGVPVWLLLSYIPDWRWFLEDNTTPWYPSMRLFRQPGPGDWKSVIQNVANHLERLVLSRKDSAPQLDLPVSRKKGVSPLAVTNQGHREDNGIFDQDADTKINNTGTRKKTNGTPLQIEKEIPGDSAGEISSQENVLLDSAAPDGNQVTEWKKCRHGTLVYLKNDMYIGKSLAFYGEFSEKEPELFARFLAPGDVVVEAGANIGAHTVFLGKQVGPRGRVIAFEPQRYIFQILCANLAINGLTWVYPRHAALGKEPGEIRVPELDYTMQNNYGGLSLSGAANGETVPLLTIDGLKLPHVKMIKADVEGMETDVLQGAKQTISRHRPVLYVEYDRKEKAGELFRMILGLDYRVFRHHPELFSPDNYFGNPENLFPNIISMNLLCFPRELPVNITGFSEVLSEDEPWSLNR